MPDLDLNKIDLGSFGLNEDQQSQLNANMTEAVKVNPDQHAQTTKLSKESGVPEFAVQSNPEQIQQKLKLDQINLEGMTQRAPKTSKFLTTDVNNSVIAQEDVVDGLLEGIERTFDGIGRSIGVGFETQLKGLELHSVEKTLGALTPGTFEDPDLLFNLHTGFSSDVSREEFVAAKEEASDRLIGEIQTLQKERQTLTPEDMNIVQEGVRAGVESLANMTPGLALTVLSGGRTAPLLVTIGAQTFTSSYGEGRAEGLTVEEARWFASIDAAIEVGTELLPTKTIETILTGKSKGLTKSALKFAVQEMGTEQLATALQTVNSYMFGLDKELENAEGAQEIINIQLRRQAVTAIATVVAGGAQIGAATAVNKTINKLTQTEQEQATQGDIEQRNIDKLSADSAKSKLRERDVESFKQFVREADGENNTHVFIDGVQTSLFLQSKTREEIEADPALKTLANAARESRATGADVAVPVDDFMGDIAGTDAATELREHMTMSEETVSPFRQEQHEVETKAYVETLMEEAQENASEYVEAQEIYTTVRDQLIDTGAVNAANASIMAQVVPAWATAQAARSGKTVQQVYTDAGLVIEGPQSGELARLEGEQVLTQPVQTVSEVQSSLTEEFDGLKLSLSGTGNNVTLNKIIIPEDQRGQGAGTQVMQRVIDWADQNGKTVALTPSKDFGGSVPRLKSFYKQLGFVENKGKNKDFEISESFYREPQQREQFKQDQPDTGVARGYYDPENSVIRLTESADLSTFLHEFAHFMYEMEASGNTDMNESINNWYKRNAEDVAAEATKNLNGNFDALKQGERTNDNKQTVTEADVVNYLDTGSSGSTDKDAAVRRAVHEQFARGFETYLMEGKAPSVELRNAFRTFARWLARIYQALRGDLNVNLDNEMRQVFDRLLATEDQIAAAESRARVEPMFTDAAMAGMTEEEFSNYQQRQEKVKDVQTETLRDKLIKAMTRKTKQWWKDEKADLTDEELDRLRNERVYKTSARLQHVAPTGDIEQQIETTKKEINEAEKQIKKLKKDNDTIGKFIAKKGGLNRESMEAEGVDPAEFKKRGGVFGKPLFPKQGGLTADGVAELLHEEGVIIDFDANEALDIINDMLFEDTRFVDSQVEGEIDSLENEISQMEQQLQESEFNLQTVNIKLDHATVKEMVGEERTDKLGRKSIRVSDKLRGMTAKGQKGVHPDEAAAFFGYNSGAEMLNDLMTAPPIKETAEANAEARMIERHGDVFTDGTIERQADEAVQNEERGKLILHELKILARGTSQRSLDRQTMKSIAAERIGNLSFREIHPGKYRKAEIRAAQEAARMLAEGNKEGAAQAKARQALNYYLGMEATTAKNDTVKIVDRMNRYNKKKVREEIQKAEGGYWEQIVKILERFEFRKSATLASVDQLNQDINTWAAERMDTHGDGLVLANVVLNESYVTHWKNVAYSDLQGIDDSVKNIEHVARYSNKLTRMGEEIEYNKLVEKLVTTAAETGTGRFKKSASTADDLSWVQQKGRWAMAQMTKIPYMMSWMDGMDRVGTWFTTFSQPMTDAYNAELELFKEVGEPVVDLIQSRSKEDMKRHNTTFFIPEIKGTAGGTHTGNLKGHEIIAVALNTGNEGNLRKLLLGEQWAQEDGTDINLQNAQLQAVLKHMTKSDWQMVQKIWDQIDILYPKLAEVHRRTTGLVPPKVEATPVETEHGTFKGGYYPVKYDPTRDNKAAEFEERKEAEVGSMFASNASIQSSVNTGATNERTGYFAPIHLTLNVVPNHIQETIHYITHHDAVREVNRLLRDPRVKDAVTEKLGPEEFAQLKPWLNDIAKDGRNAPNKSIVDAMFNKLRLGTTLGVMGFKASTGIIQISGLSNTIAEVGMKPVMQSMRTILGSVDSMRSAWEFATEKSKVLKHRTKTMDRELMNAMQQLESRRGVFAAIQEASMKHIALIQTYMVDLPSWHAAYIKELGESGDEKRAFQYADWVIENVQGSGVTKDMAGLMRNQTKTHTIFTMFMTFFSALWNLQRDLVKGAQSGKYSTTTVAAKAMFLFTIPVLFEMMMRGEFAKEDQEPEELLQETLTKVALYPIASIPFVRDAANGLFSGYQYNASPVTSIVEQGLQGLKGAGNAVLADGELTKGQVKSISKLAGAGLGIPGTGQAWATGEHLYGVLVEGEEFTTHQFLFGPERK